MKYAKHCLFLLFITLLLSIGSASASNFSQEHIVYAWTGVCGGTAGVDGECSGNATATLTFDNYTIAGDILTPTSISSFSYFDNDPLFIYLYGNSEYTWDFNASAPAALSLAGSLPATDEAGTTSSNLNLTFSNFSLQTGTAETVTFYSNVDDTWSFTSTYANFFTGEQILAAGDGSGSTLTVHVPEPSSIALIGLGLLGFSLSRKKRNYR